jgi:hypothetical protein
MAKSDANWYYPECDGEWFECNLPLRWFESAEIAVNHFKERYGTSLMAVIKDDEPLSVVYERD